MRDPIDELILRGVNLAAATFVLLFFPLVGMLWLLDAFGVLAAMGVTP